MLSYSCKRCGYTTNKISNMKDHLHRITLCKPKSDNNIPENWIEESLKRIYSGINNKYDMPTIHHCFFCNKIFSSSYNLSRHKRSMRCLEKNEIIVNSSYIK